MSVGVELLERRIIVRKIHAQIHFILFFVSLPATKELVPTDSAIQYHLRLFFFLSLLLQNQRISGSPISASLPWVTGEEAAGSKATSPNPRQFLWLQQTLPFPGCSDHSASAATYRGCQRALGPAAQPAAAAGRLQARGKWQHQAASRSIGI